MKNKYFNRFHVIQLAILVVLVGAINFILDYFPDLFGSSGYNVTLYGIMILLSMAVFSHVAHRVLFPLIDLEKLYKVALKEPLASAVVFASIVYFLSKLVEVGSSILR